MKAVLALIIIYIGTFFLVIHGATQNAAQAAPQGATSAQDNAASAQPNSAIDPTKEADIRSLMELVGAHDATGEPGRVAPSVRADQQVHPFELRALREPPGQERPRQATSDNADPHGRPTSPACR